jgi:lysylphosphatidylglycerol synthetase-like protein (DUF2156 family)
VSKSAAQPLPQPLPPERRTIGQLVAETLRLYGRRFWAAVPLGLAFAALDQLRDQPWEVWLPVACAGAVAISLAYAFASALVGGVRLTRRTGLVAVAVGVVAFLPPTVLLRWFILLGLVWLAFFALAVPAAVLERRGVLDSLRRGFRLARADYVHALGSLATLALLYFLTSVMLAVLLREQGDQTERIATFLADLVLSPVFLLGAALLYYDQEARERMRSDAKTDERPGPDVRRVRRRARGGTPRP